MEKDAPPLLLMLPQKPPRSWPDPIPPLSPRTFSCHFCTSIRSVKSDASQEE
eukprot:COSAG01_NODE_8969_length_2599_cov_1.883600_4_plen_52_part_00